MPYAVAMVEQKIIERSERFLSPSLVRSASPKMIKIPPVEATVSPQPPAIGLRLIEKATDEPKITQNVQDQLDPMSRLIHKSIAAAKVVLKPAPEVPKPIKLEKQLIQPSPKKPSIIKILPYPKPLKIELIEVERDEVLRKYFEIGNTNSSAESNTSFNKVVMTPETGQESKKIRQRYESYLPWLE